MTDDDIWEGESTINRHHLLAAETFNCSYANYQDQLDAGNERFSKEMPAAIDVLERAEKDKMSAEDIAKALNYDPNDPERVELIRSAFRRAKDIVDAPTSVEAFRRGVRHSIREAVENGIEDNEDIEELVTQVCYRVADLAVLLENEAMTLGDYSLELRKEPDIDWDAADG